MKNYKISPKDIEAAKPKKAKDMSGPLDDNGRAEQDKKLYKPTDIDTFETMIKRIENIIKKIADGPRKEQMQKRLDELKFMKEKKLPKDLNKIEITPINKNDDIQDAHPIFDKTKEGGNLDLDPKVVSKINADEDEETKKLKWALLDILPGNLEYDDLQNIVKEHYDDERGITITEFADGSIMEIDDEGLQDEEIMEKFMEKIKVEYNPDETPEASVKAKQETVLIVNVVDNDDVEKVKKLFDDSGWSYDIKGNDFMLPNDSETMDNFKEEIHKFLDEAKIVHGFQKLIDADLTGLSDEDKQDIAKQIEEAVSMVIDRELDSFEPESKKDDEIVKDILTKAFDEVNRIYKFKASISASEFKSAMTDLEYITEILEKNLNYGINDELKNAIDNVRKSLQLGYNGVLNASINADEEENKAKQKKEKKPDELPQSDIFDVAEGLPLGNGMMAHKDEGTGEIYVLNKDGDEMVRTVNAFVNDMALVIEFYRDLLGIKEEKTEKEKKVESAEGDPVALPNDEDEANKEDEEDKSEVTEEVSEPTPETSEDKISKKLDELIDVQKEQTELLKKEGEEAPKEDEELPSKADEKLLDLQYQVEEKKKKAEAAFLDNVKEKRNKVKAAMKFMIENNLIKVNEEDINDNRIKGESVIFAKQRAQEVKMKEIERTLWNTPNDMINFYLESLEQNDIGRAGDIYNMFMK